MPSRSSASLSKEGVGADGKAGVDGGVGGGSQSGDVKGCCQDEMEAITCLSDGGGVFKISGMGTPSTSARATAIAEALENRSLGFLSRLRRMIVDKAGEISGFNCRGGVGVAVICCIMITEGLSP